MPLLNTIILTFCLGVRKTNALCCPPSPPFFGESGADFFFKIQFEIKKTIDSWACGQKL